MAWEIWEEKAEGWKNYLSFTRFSSSFSPRRRSGETRRLVSSTNQIDENRWFFSSTNRLKSPCGLLDEGKQRIRLRSSRKRRNETGCGLGRRSESKQIEGGSARGRSLLAVAPQSNPKVKVLTFFPSLKVESSTVLHVFVCGLVVRIFLGVLHVFDCGLVVRIF